MPSVPRLLMRCSLLCLIFGADLFQILVAGQPTTSLSKPVVAFVSGLPGGSFQGQETLLQMENRPTVRVFGETDTMPRNAVMAMTVDSKGYMWVGTQNGAAYYNGRVWTSIQMPQATTSNFITALVTTSDGSMWFGTRGAGLLRMKDQVWTSFNQENGGIPGNRVRCLTEVRHLDGQFTLWVGTEKGLARFENNRWQIYTQKNSGLPDDSIFSLCAVSNKTGNFVLWVGTNHGLARLEQETWTSELGMAGSLPSLQIRSLFWSSSGVSPTLWVGTTGGLAKWTHGKWTSYTTQNSPLPENLTTGLLETTTKDGAQVLWAGTFGGLARVENDQWTIYDTRNSGLPDNQIRCLMKLPGREGNRSVWIGTDGGLAQLQEGLWTTLDARLTSLPTRHIRCLFESRSTSATPGLTGLWMGTHNGLVLLQEGRLLFLTAQTSGLPNNRVETVLETREGANTVLWVGTNGGGLARCVAGSWKVFNTENSPLPDNAIFSLSETVAADGRRRLWVGTGSGLASLENDIWTIYNAENSPIPGERVNVLYETGAADGGRALWIGTNGSGLIRFQGGTWTVYHSGNSSLPNNSVVSLHETIESNGRHRLWIGTFGGAAQLDPHLLNSPWLPLPEAIQQMLWSSVVSQICHDRQGRMYFCTFKGVIRFTPQPDDTGPLSVRIFTTDDGLPANSVNPRAALVDQTGRLWVGTINGAAFFDPGQETEDQTADPLCLESVLVNHEPWNVSQLANKSLTYDQNQLTFNYALLSYHHESETLYQSQLIGFDPERSVWTKESKRTYTNLPPGTYTFQIWGQDYGGNISQPIAVSFTIRPAPWRTWLAYCGYTALLLSFGYWMFRLRLRVVSRRQEIRIRYLSKLLESTRAINSELDLLAVLQNIADQSARLIDAAPSGIGLIEGNQLVFHRLWRRGTWEDRTRVFELGQGVAGRVAATAQPVIVNDTETYAGLAFPEEIQEFKICGFMNVPIVNRTGVVVGVLDVHRPQGRQPFTETDLKVIQSLANQAAVAIENAALYGKLAENQAALQASNQLVRESMEELKKLYEQEQQVTKTLQELDRMKHNFIVVTSHEMRTPLTVLNGYVEVLAEEMFGQINVSQRRALTTCKRMVDRLMTTFDNILEMLRLNAAQAVFFPTTFELNVLLETILAEVSPFSTQRQQFITFDAARAVSIEADQEKIELALFNVIQNAIKFTPDHGCIWISCQAESEGAHIMVRDSGIGISNEELEHIFDHFYTHSDASTHTSGTFEFSARGTGLGLAIAKRYILAHSGKIWAESFGPGQGSCFHVFLPYSFQNTTASHLEGIDVHH